MAIYYLLAEAVPDRGNPERLEFGGAYVNCWVKAGTEAEALTGAAACIRRENWVMGKVLEISTADKQWYANEPDCAECYDEACAYGASAIFNTWPLD